MADRVRRSKIGVPKEEKENGEDGEEPIFEEIIPKDFPELL